MPLRRSPASQAAARLLDPETPAATRRRTDIDFNRRPINQSVKCSDPDCIPAADSSREVLTVKIVRTKHMQTQEYTNSHAFLFNEPSMPSDQKMAKLEELHKVMEGEAVTKCALCQLSPCASHVY